MASGRITWILGAGSVLALAGCSGDRPFDLDFRDLGGGFSTAGAAQVAPDRPAPDARGIITYPSGQVVLAQDGETVRAIAQRLGRDPAEIANFNGVTPDTPLRRDQAVALTPGATTTLPAATAPTPIGTSTLATTPLAPAAPTTAPAGSVRHVVVAGETAYTIARLYQTTPQTLAMLNGLGADLAVQPGQSLVVPPPPAGTAPAPATQPGQGSPTPTPPSAAAPLPTGTEPPASAPAPTPEPVQDLAAERTEAPSAQLGRPVEGSIIRAYAPGRNEGIDIGAAAGTEVKAAEAGVVAAITTNTDGIRIVVIKHANDLLTVYTHLDNLTVAKDQQVTRGQTIGRVRAGDPSFLHFEVRRGMASQDPTEYLP